MNKEREKVYREMLTDLKNELQNIEWQIKWLESKVSLGKEVPDVTVIFNAERHLEPSLFQDDITQVKRNPAPTEPTVTDLIESILDNNQLPMHGSEILLQLHDKGRTGSTMKSITGGMPQDSKGRFKNLGKNTWALSKWPETMKAPRRSA